MIDLSALTPSLVAFLVFAVVAAGLAVATLVRLAADARKPRSRPVVLVTASRVPTRSAA